MAGYNELSGSPKIGLSESGGPTITRTFVVDWADHLSFIASELTDPDSVGYYDPATHPSMAGCRVQSVEIEPLTSELSPSGTVTKVEDDLASYSSPLAAKITVNYGPSFFHKTWLAGDKPQLREGTSLRLRIRGTGQFLTLPARAFEWEQSPGDITAGNPAPPVPPDENSRILIPLTEYQFQWDYIDDPNYSWMEDHVGHVNSDTFCGCEPGTLLFENWESDDAFKLDYTDPHTQKHMIFCRRRKIKVGNDIFGWNHEFREKTGWTIMRMNGELRYPETAFALLFA